MRVISMFVFVSFFVVFNNLRCFAMQCDGLRALGCREVRSIVATAQLKMQKYNFF